MILNVKTMLSTAPFKLVHLDVYGTFSTLTSASYYYHIIYIINYLLYTTVWILLDMKLKIFTSDYKWFQARVDTTEYEV